MTCPPALIAIRNFSFTYAGMERASLTDINLEVGPGEFVVLAGKSGCGKSTLLRCLNGIIPHLLSGQTNGEICISGKRSSELTPEDLSSVAGSVFQNPRSQFFHINVTDEIAFGPESRDFPKEEIVRRVDEAFDLFGISHLRDKKMYELSSGEQQKISFAAIYATGADILFLDEPSANLDFQAIENLRNILELLKSKGKTIVIAEHRLYYFAELFDRLVVLDNGQIQKNVFHRTELTNDLMASYGLRTMDLQNLIASTDTPPATEKGTADCNISARNISFAYPRGKKKILRDISLDLMQGKKIAVIGPNGSGKTTLTKLIAGLLKPNKGYFRDVSHGKLSARKRLRSCGLVLQEHSHQLFCTTVMEELASSRFDRHTADGSPLDILRDLGLERLQNAHPQNLSAGQQQRLVFAIAAINSPRVLILDEPTSGLDAHSMHAMGKKITTESAKGATVLIVTHDFEFVATYCDMALVLDNGKIQRRIERKDFKTELLSAYNETKQGDISDPQCSQRAS